MCFVTNIADTYLTVQLVLIRAGYFPQLPIELVYDGLHEEV